MYVVQVVLIDDRIPLFMRYIEDKDILMRDNDEHCSIHIHYIYIYYLIVIFILA